MKKLLAIGLLALSLGGCAGELAKIKTTFTNVVGVISNVKINSKAAYIAINVFNGTERTVTNYLKFPPCNGSIPVCRVSGAADALDEPFNAGISARNDMRAWMKANPGSLADAGLYNALIAATNSLQKVMAIYNIGTGGSK
jgi:hypothetical protein